METGALRKRKRNSLEIPIDEPDRVTPKSVNGIQEDPSALLRQLERQKARDWARNMQGETPSLNPFRADPLMVLEFPDQFMAAVEESFAFFPARKGQTGSVGSSRPRANTNESSTPLTHAAGGQANTSANSAANAYATFQLGSFNPSMSELQRFGHADTPNAFEGMVPHEPAYGQPNTPLSGTPYLTRLNSVVPSFSPIPAQANDVSNYASGNPFQGHQADLKTDGVFAGQMQGACPGPIGQANPFGLQQVHSYAHPRSYSPALYLAQTAAGVYKEMPSPANGQLQQGLGHQRGNVKSFVEAGPWSLEGQRNRDLIPSRETSSPPMPSSRSHDYTSSPSATPPSEASTPSGAAGRINNHQARIAKSGNGYGDDLEGRPPIGVKPPKGIQLSAIEILTFCPRWLHHPDVVLRLLKAGWKREDIAKAQLYATNNLDYPRMKRVAERVQKQISMAGKLKLDFDQTATWSNEVNLPRIAVYDDLTAEKWMTRHEYDSSKPYVEWTDYKLADIAAPVKQGGNWPSLEDSLLFTQCLEYAYQHQELNLTIADCGRIVKEQEFEDPGQLNHTHDVQALKRFSDHIPTPAETASARQAKQATQKKLRAKAKGRALARGWA